MTRRRRHGPIIKLADDVYVEWSGPCDAPSRAFTETEVLEILDAEVADAREALELAQAARTRLEEHGHTLIDRDSTPQALVRGNRAGENEKRLTYDQLVAQAREQLADRGTR
jgi:sirohydrochlorin ferrochelatase